MDLHRSVEPRPPSGLLEVLELERIEVDLFRGRSPHEPRLRTFGGQVAAQALLAAGRTVDADRAVHSLHAYFILPGDPRQPIVFQVARTRDGGSFTTRHVTAVQSGRAIFTMIASFQRHAEGPEHQATGTFGDSPRPPLPPADALPHDVGVPDGNSQTFPVEAWFQERNVSPGVPGLPRQALWARVDGTLPDDPLVHACALTYISDLHLLAAALPPHGYGDDHMDHLDMASLDHAVWFHQPVRADDWMYYPSESPYAAGGRAMVNGRMFDRDGVLLASVAQEGLFRLRRPPQA